ncbi:MAG: cache domain-containing protein, partial [Acidobacteriota bacterium]|nr:cache domain-containing protein [Acidobacteriota bacterium]
MSIIRSIAKRDSGAIRSLYFQLFVVVLAFVLMVVSSSLYVSNMLRNHLRGDAMDLLNQTKLRIEADLIEPEATLAAISNTIRNMILNGDGEDAVLGYIQDAADVLQNKTSGFKFYGLYGYFDVFGGRYLFSNWDPPEDFEPTDRPWYKAGIEAGDRVALTPIYKSPSVNDYIVTYVHRIFNKENQPLGIVGLNMPLDGIKNAVANMRLTESSYGIFANENLDIFHHYDPAFIGKNAHEIGGNFAVCADELEATGALFEREVVNNKGELAVVFSTRLKNGWFLFTVTPKAEYYRELRDMQLMLGILGAFLAAALIIVLIRVNL